MVALGGGGLLLLLVAFIRAKTTKADNFVVTCY